jgi:MucB/RseB N-terminal domain
MKIHPKRNEYKVRRTLLCCAALFSASMVCGAQAVQPPVELNRRDPGPAGRQLPKRVRGAQVRRPGLTPEEKQARELLRLMLKPNASYVATQETVLQNSRGITSEQQVEGDTRGFVRIQFSSPEKIAGDVMIIGPQSFYSYHHSRNQLEVALWPTEYNDESKRMFANILSGSVSARLVGNEVVAGRSAGIVELSVVNAAGIPQHVLRRLWIDQQTGILLRIQKSNNRGQITSTTGVTSIQVNPSTPISPDDFRPTFRGAFVNPLFPDAQFKSLQEAQSKLPFQPIEPNSASLPMGFRLEGVWVFGPDKVHPNQRSVLLKYTDGVSSFCLYERVVPAGKQPISRPRPGQFAANQQTWRLPFGTGELTVHYIGHLPREQAMSLYDAMH